MIEGYFVKKIICTSVYGGKKSLEDTQVLTGAKKTKLDVAYVRYIYATSKAEFT